MTVQDFNTSIRYKLQDEAKNRWTDVELLDYTNEGLRDIAVRTFYNKIDEDISVLSTQTTYTLTKEPIKVYSVNSYQQFTQPTKDTLLFTNPRDEDITVTYYAYPDAVTTDIDEDIDIIDALKYFVLSKAYEKEDIAENFNKAIYFQDKYISYISENMTRWHGDEDVMPDKSDFFK
ncbi:DUF6682 family protein [Sulfurimonas sp.]|uniref:phage adaptor protein n=1 Tax=Sulfurimonas sp. TaxID=2022749 RepID=UPI003564C4A9